MPKSSKNICFSSSSSSAISCSISALITKTSQLLSAANFLTAATWSFELPSSAKSSSETLAAKITGLAVNKLYSWSHASSSSSSVSNLIARFPSSRNFFILCWKSSSFASALSFLAPLVVFAILLSNISTSEKINSRLIVSISLIGSTLPSTWITLVSSKHLTTCTIASTSRMLARNWFPKPSPFEAPFTSPAISTNSITAGIVFAELYIAVNLSNLSSGTETTPTFGSIVQKG